MARDLDSLVRLQSALTEARSAKEQLESVPDSMRELHEEHQAHSHIVQTLESQILEAELSRRGSEAGAQDAQVKLARFQEHVNRVSTQREYGSLLSEIDAAKAELSVHEEEALASIEKIDEATAELDENKVGYDELDGRYQEALQEWELRKPSVAKELEELEAEVQDLRKGIPQNLLLHFERLFDRLNGQALAEISKVEKVAKRPSVWHCANCNYRVRPQVVVDIRNNGNLHQCESCQRFLFWQEE